MRILLADDQSEVRSALHLLLEQEAGLTIVEEVSEADELLAQVEMTCPDVVLLDWELPGLQASVVVPSLTRYVPPPIGDRSQRIAGSSRSSDIRRCRRLR